MTIYVNEDEPIVNIAFNQVNLTVGGFYFFKITSQYSHQTTTMFPGEVVTSNARYSMIQVTFPAGFGDAHKNGIYYYELRSTIYPVGAIEKGLVKIITNPGGEINTLEYNSGTVTEERVSEVFFRPQYT
tara:strand:- start:380 stop:766 length:387 start_codon:yes stop_codon:yes gene_type:complete